MQETVVDHYNFKLNVNDVTITIVKVPLPINNHIVNLTAGRL